VAARGRALRLRALLRPRLRRPRGPIITAIAAQLFPGRRFGVIYGLLSVGNGIGGGIAPWFGGFVHDLTGSYRVAFLIAVSFCFTGAACFWLARPPRLA
jgi:MFS family permease